MKKEETEEPKEYFERNMIVLTILIAISAFFIWYSIHLLVEVNPWGTLTAVPGLVLSFQSLWLMLNPYAMIFNNHFEIKQSWIYTRQFEFLDLKGIEMKGSQIYLVYNDGDQEKIPMAGIRPSHRQLFIDKLNEKIKESLSNRNF